jgi:hypothetical protein
MGRAAEGESCETTIRNDNVTEQFTLRQGRVVNCKRKRRQMQVWKQMRWQMLRVPDLTLQRLPIRMCPLINVNASIILTRNSIQKKQLSQPREKIQARKSPAEFSCEDVEDEDAQYS